MFFTLLLLSVCWYPQALWAAQAQSPLAPPQETQALESLRERTAAIATLSCSFTQETDIPLFTAPVVSTGTLRFKKPGMIAWEYRSPIAEGFVLAGDKGYRWHDSPDARVPFSTAGDPLAALVARQMLSWISCDLQWIMAEYSLAVSIPEPLTLTLTPRRSETGAVLENLTIAFSPQGVAESVVLREKSGGKTRLRFHNIVLNKPLADEEFR
jgi:outer membrane lipoprotein carrier protein